MFRHSSLILSINLALAAAGCALDIDSEPELEIDDSQASLVYATSGVSPAAMAAEIHDDLRGQVVGYGFAINLNNALAYAGSGGLAQRPVDGQASMVSTRPMQVASVSKSITAIATLKLLEANGLSLSSKVAPWLPPSWTQGWGWSQITFHDLLAHRSGLGQLWYFLSQAQQDQWGNDWDGLEYVVSLGASHDSPESYKNANYALLRVIIPALWKASPGSPNIPYINEYSYGVWHLAYMQQHVFNPAGVTSAGCWEKPGVIDAYHYNLNEPNQSGNPSNFEYDGCGGHAGWHLSARDLAAVMRKARYDDSYFSPASRFVMDIYKLGWSSASNTNSNGRLGKWWHGGSWTSSGRAGRACVMKYTGNIEAALVVNSQTPKDACTILKDAYNNAN